MPHNARTHTSTTLALIHQPRPVIATFFQKAAFSPPGYTRWVLQKLPGGVTWGMCLDDFQVNRLR